MNDFNCPFLYREWLQNLHVVISPSTPNKLCTYVDNNELSQTVNLYRQLIYSNYIGFSTLNYPQATTLLLTNRCHHNTTLKTHVKTSSLTYMSHRRQLRMSLTPFQHWPISSTNHVIYPSPLDIRCFLHTKIWIELWADWIIHHLFIRINRYLNKELRRESKYKIDHITPNKTFGTAFNFVKLFWFPIFFFSFAN